MTARDRLVVIVVVVAGLAAAAWFLVLSSQRAQLSDLSGQVAAQRQTRDSALADVAAGLAAKHDYAHDYATVAQLGTAVPDDDNVASLMYQVQHAANATGVDFRSLQVGQGSAASTPPPAPPAPTSSTSTSSGAAPATQAATATLPPGASVGAAGFPTMPFSFTFEGDFFHLSDFLGRLERFLVVRNRSVSVSGRFMTLDGIALNAAPRGFPRIQATVAATTYLLPATQGLTNGATPSGPASASSSAGGTGSGGGVPTPTATATGPVR